MGRPILTVADQLLEWTQLRLRWAIVAFAVSPLSTFYDIILTLRNDFIFAIGAASRAHERKVASIQKQMREWAASGQRTKVQPVEGGLFDIFRPALKKGISPVYTGTLTDILAVDTDRLCVRVEPMVTLSQLARALLPRGYCVPIFPGWPGLTIQDLIYGGGVDASGRKYGLFQHICLSFELVMPDGSVVEASKEKHGDAETQALFYGVPWSEGTLGITVAVTLRIIAIKPYVKVTYMPTNTVEELKSKLTEECSCRENEFVEGLQLSRNTGVVLRGRFSEGPPKNFSSNITRIGRWYWPWFYTHVEAVLSTNKELTEFIPIRDYYYRHTRSSYWELRDLAPFANSFLYRWFCGWMSAPRREILKVFTPNLMNPKSQCVQIHEDILIPMEHLSKIVELCDSETEIYPLWLCPYNQPSCPGMVRQRTGRNVLFVNVGVYGMARRSSASARDCIRRLEQAAREANGVTMVHRGTEMSRSEFWEMFDSSLYEWLRVKYNCKGAFVDVYDKVCQVAS